MGDATSTYFKSRTSSPFAVACSAVDSPLRDLLAPYQAVIPSADTLIIYIDLCRVQNVPAINICYQEGVSASQGGVMFEKEFHKPCQDILDYLFVELWAEIAVWCLFKGGANLPDRNQLLLDGDGGVCFIVM